MHSIKLYNFPRSGHAHRVELMLSLLDLPSELILSIWRRVSTSNPISWR